MTEMAVVTMGPRNEPFLLLLNLIEYPKDATMTKKKKIHNSAWTLHGRIPALRASFRKAPTTYRGIEVSYMLQICIIEKSHAFAIVLIIIIIIMRVM